MRDYLKEKGVHSIGQLHESLNNMDAIRLILEKRRALWYPEKTALSGLLWEFQQRHMYDADNVSMCTSIPSTLAEHVRHTFRRSSGKTMAQVSKYSV